MVSPEGYQAGYLDTLENKLFVIRDADGRPNTEAKKVIRFLQKKMSREKSFGGLALIGSSAFGYGTQEPHGEHTIQSDVDFATFFDSSVDPHAEEKLENIYHVEHKRAITDDIYKTPVHMTGAHRFDLNPTTIDGFFNEIGKDEKPKDIKEARHIFEGLAILAGLAVGPGIGQYRAMISEKIRQLPEEKRTKFIHVLAELAVEAEQSRSERGPGTKMQERIFPNAAPEKVAEMLAMREELWRERIKKVYNL